jgi:hypothetical protein
MQKVAPSEKLGLEQLSAAVPEKYRENVTGLFNLFNPAESKLELGDIDTSRYVYRPPMIRIKQAMSRTNLPAKNGDLYSPDTGEIYQRPMLLIPIFTWENRMKFGEMGEKEICISEDKEHSTAGLICSQCPDRPWKDKQRQDCNDFLNFFFITLDFAKMYKVSFSGGSAKAGRNIISQCMSAAQNLWTRVYSLDTEEIKGPKGPYHAAVTTFVEASPKELQFAGAELNKALKQMRMAVKADLATKLAENAAVIATAVGTNEAPGKNMADFANL